MEEKWFWRRSKCHFPITIRTAANFDRWRIGFKDNIVGGRRPAGEWLAPTLTFFPVIDPSPRLPGILRLLSRVSRSSTFICPITIFQLWFLVEQGFYFFHPSCFGTPRFARVWCPKMRQTCASCNTRFLDWFGMLSVQIWQKSLCSNAPLQKLTFFDLCLVARPPSSQTCWMCIISYTFRSVVISKVLSIKFFSAGETNDSR